MTGTGLPGDHPLILERLALRLVSELEVDAATIGLATGDTSWLPAYATSASAADLAQYAFTVGEGPCVDALRSHALVYVADLTTVAATARWPLWSVAADEAGIGSVAAFPVQAGAITAGVLTAYSSAVGRLSRDQIRTGLRLADAALLGLLDLTGVATEADDDGERTGDASELSAVLRGDVHLAAGMIMAQANVSIDEALARLRAHAFSSGRPLTEVASDVVDRRLRFEPDLPSAQ
jgi:hypothetical protein